MLHNYIKIAYRNLVKNKLHAGINIFGLAIGFVIAILSIIYIKNEVNYEKWIPNNDRVYRAYRQGNTQTSGGWIYSPGTLAPTLATEIAGVEKATKLYEAGEVLFTRGEKSIYIDKVANVDSIFFDVFAFPFIAGDPTTALDGREGMVISERIAKLFFGEENPIGQTLKLDGEYNYMINGVMKMPEGGTYMDYEVYLPFWEGAFNHWLNNGVTTYILKEKNASIAQITEKTDKLLFPIYKREYAAVNMPIEDKSQMATWKFQALTDVHLYSGEFGGFRESQGNIDRLYIFSLIAFVVLLIACINYMNLATAKATGRAKEVGMRKVSGAQRKQLIIQFLAESVLQSFAAIGIALILTEFLLPVFNEVTNRSLTFFSGNWQTIFFPLLALSLVIGLLAGIYPAFFLSKYEPVKVLKGNLMRNNAGQFLRKSLVVTQFSISVILIIIMAFVYKQVNYMQTQDLGFDEEQVMTIEINRPDSWHKFENRKTAFEQIPGVQSVALSNNLPGSKLGNYTLHKEGTDELANPDILFVNGELDKTLGLELVEGRFFSEEYATDTLNAWVVNETFIKTHKIENPIGKGLKFVYEDTYGKIIGVVKDFHFRGLQHKIRPLAMSAQRNQQTFLQLSLKLDTKNIMASVNAINAEWSKIEPNHPVRFAFLDENFAKQYKENESFGQTMLYATGLAIFIAMLGLFGLASFMAEQRTKEIGVRKVLGASVVNLIHLLVKDFVKLVLIAGLVAIPLGYLLVKRWLEDFAYSTSITAFPFILAITGAVFLAIFTVSYQSIKVSSANPIKALKTE